MEESGDIFIRMQFEGFDRFPAGFLGQSLYEVETALFEAELEELDQVFKVLDELPSATRDACAHRIRSAKGNTLLLESASSGSIVLFGVVAALSYWVVKNTIGETVKEAYKESELHDRLKQLLLNRIGARPKELEARIHQRLFIPVSDPQVIASVSTHYENGQPTIEIALKLNKTESIPPKPSRLFDGSGD